MRTLALDTATPATAVAVGDGHTAYGLRDEPHPGERPGHARLVLRLATEAMEEMGWRWSELERIVVGRGPGTFTGLRIGIATARGLAESLGISLLGVSTLESVAVGVAQHAFDGEVPGVALAVLDARRAELFAAAWRVAAGLGAPLMESSVLAPERLAAWVAERSDNVVAVGHGAVASRAVLEGAGAAVPADGDALHRVDAVHLLTVAGNAAGGSPDTVQPDYLRIPDAELNRRRAAESDAH